MAHGFCGRRPKGIWLPFTLLCVVACAAPAPAPPDTGALLPPPLAERCGNGQDPIEILAADVAIVIDRSTSTRNPSGIDLDGDGSIGEFRRSQYTDRGDSMLAAELAAVVRLVDVARLGGMRFAIVSYSGRDDYPLENSVNQWVDRRDARIEAELTDDVAALSNALARVGRRGSDGSTSFAPAMKLAVRSLRPGESEQPPRLRRVLLLADSPTPVRLAPGRLRIGRHIARDDPRMQMEARRAIEAGVRFHTFGIGLAAETEPPFALAQIAGATGGIYRAVPDPRQLYCQLLAALGPGESR